MIVIGVLGAMAVIEVLGAMALIAQSFNLISLSARYARSGTFKLISHARRCGDPAPFWHSTKCSNTDCRKYAK